MPTYAAWKTLLAISGAETIMTSIGITGHQNIPKDAVPYIKNRIENALRPLEGNFIGVSSLAEGADQIFVEIVLRLGGKLHVVIPCDKYEKTFEENSAYQKYKNLLSKADEIEVLKNPEPSEDAYFEAGRRIVDMTQELIAIWDGCEARGKGGTADVVKYANGKGKKVVVIWPAGRSR